MKIKSGDTIEFIALEWREPQWEFDHPTVVLKPCFNYSPNGDSMEKMIEDMAIDFCCDEDIQDEDYSEEFNWRRWKVKNMLKTAINRLKGKDDWKSRGARVMKRKIFFYQDEGEITFDILETVEK